MDAQAAATTGPADSEAVRGLIDVELVAGIGHDVRTPLHSCRGTAELLAETALAPDQRQLVQEIIDAASALGTVTERALALAELACGTPTASADTVDVVELLDWVRTRAAGIRIESGVSDELPEQVVTDAVRLRQVLDALVDEAVAAGATALGLRLDGGDAGVDLQLHADVRPGPTPGLRRALARAQATVLGGALRETVGEGVNWSLTLPIRDTTVGTAATHPLHGDGADVSSGRPVHVLIVDDNEVNRLLAQRQVRKLGFEATCADGGAEGVRLTLESTFDVVLMDNRMPDVDGREATRRIRDGERASGRATPIVALTAGALPEDREACLAAGMNDFLTKPVDLQTLEKTLRFWSAPGRSEVPEQLPELALDRKVLIELLEAVGGEVETLVDLVRAYHGKLVGRRLRVLLASSENRREELALAARSLGSSSAAVGALALAAHCRAVESAALRGDRGDLRQIVEQVARESSRVKRLLDACDVAVQVRAAVGARSGEPVAVAS